MTIEKKVLKIARKRLPFLKIKSVTISDYTSGVYSGYIETYNLFKVGFCFFNGDILSLTMTDKDLNDNYLRYLLDNVIGFRNR